MKEPIPWLGYSLLVFGFILLVIPLLYLRRGKAKSIRVDQNEETAMPESNDQIIQNIYGNSGIVVDSYPVCPYCGSREIYQELYEQTTTAGLYRCARCGKRDFYPNIWQLSPVVKVESKE